MQAWINVLNFVREAPEFERLEGQQQLSARASFRWVGKEWLLAVGCSVGGLDELTIYEISY